MTKSNANPTGTVSYSADWSVFARRTAAVGLLVACVYAATLIGPLLQIVLLSLVLTFVLIYPALLISRLTPLSYPLSAVIVFLLFLAIFAFAILFLAVPLATFLADVTQNLEMLITQSFNFLKNYTPDQGLLKHGLWGENATDLDIILSPLSRWVKTVDIKVVAGFGATLLGTFGEALGIIGDALVTLLLVNVLALVFLLEMPVFFRYLFAVVPLAYRREYAILFRRIAHVWGSFWKGSMIAALFTAAIALVQMLVMGIPFAPLIALVAGITTFIPIVGAVLAAVPIAIVPFVYGSSVLHLDPLTLAILTSVIYQLVQLILWHTVIPKIYGSALNMPISMVILVIAIGTAWWGILGAFVAIPLTAIIREVVRYVLKKIRGGLPYPNEPEPTYLARGIFGVVISEDGPAET